MADRLAQVAGHLSGAHPRGLLAGEVAIVTGASLCSDVSPAIAGTRFRLAVCSQCATERADHVPASA